MSKTNINYNSTSEPVIFGAYYRKSDAFANAYPNLLGVVDEVRNSVAKIRWEFI